MIGDDHDRRAGRRDVDDLADELIRAPVDAFDRVAEFLRERRVERGMRGIEQPEHHVLHAIGRFDHADEEIPVVARELIEDDVRAVVERAEQVVHERLLVDALLTQRVGRLRPAERAVRPEPLVEIRGEARRRGERHRRRVRPEVDGRRVELELVAGVREIERAASRGCG